MSKFPEMEQVAIEFGQEEQEQVLEEISIGRIQYDQLNKKQIDIVYNDDL